MKGGNLFNVNISMKPSSPKLTATSLIKTSKSCGFVGAARNEMKETIQAYTKSLVEVILV